MTKKQIGIVWGLLIALSLLLFSKKIGDPPSGRHAWALADHYAISLGFINNGFDFFHPETYCLNPQFSPAKKGEKKPEFWTVVPENPQGITAVDFPIHQYFVALIMKALDNQSPAIYRLYMLVLSLLGLFYLCKTSYFLSHSFLFSLFLVIFVLLAPTFTYYAVGFLPSTASLALLFIGAYHFVKHQRTEQFSSYIYALIFMTLAALARFPFIIYSIGLIGLYVMRAFTKKKIAWKKLIGAFISVAIVLAYFAYNKLYLFKNYGSDFLSYPLYAENFSEFAKAIYDTLLHESWRYMTLIHYLVLLFIGIRVFKGRKKIKINTPNRAILNYLSIVTLGVVSYCILMVKQLVAHDYYALDSFFPVLVFWILASFQGLKFTSFKNARRYLILFAVLSFGFNKLVYKFGYEIRKNNPLEITRNNFKNSHLILDSLQISKNAKILLLDAYSPNTAFTSMQRKGYCVMTTSYENINRAMNWNYDYIITQNFTYQKEVLQSYPDFEKQTVPFFKNENFTIHLKK